MSARPLCIQGRNARFRISILASRSTVHVIANLTQFTAVVTVWVLSKALILSHLPQASLLSTTYNPINVGYNFNFRQVGKKEKLISNGLHSLSCKRVLVKTLLKQASRYTCFYTKK